jgi:hypothetical protein
MSVEALELQRRNNRATRGMWAAYAHHRARVMSLVPEGSGRLAILGAGNCNDIELGALAQRFEQITLVDLDRAAIDRAIRRLPAAACSRIDVRALDFDALDADAFDVVLSTCVLSQLVWTRAELLGGRRHPGFDSAARAVVEQHLATAVALTKPGGTVALAIDALVLKKAPVDPPKRALALADAHGECVPFTAPSFVIPTLSAHPRVAELGLTEPWLWRIPPSRALLVYGITASIE